MQKGFPFLSLTLLALLLTGEALASSISVTPSTDATALANNLAGAGITINSATLTGGANQQGFFTGGTGNLPFASGILLTSGSVQNAVGPNSSPSATAALGTAGDAQLTALAGAATHDANVLHIEFTPTSNVISFQFVFGSEEYNEFVGSQFNDVFGFFLNGNNIALVPGTNTPIAINNVNCGSHSAFYVNNDPVDTTDGGCTGPAAGLDMQYDGFAGGLGALALFATGSVTPNALNTIDLKIADTSDDILDSGVFLAANSFIPGPPPAVPEPASVLLIAGGLGALGVARKKLRA